MASRGAPDPGCAGNARSTQTESLLLKPALTPPDYAQAWALTHYLALKRGEDFVKYFKAMSQIPPLEPRTPEQNLAEFRRFFGDDLTRLDKKLDDYIRKLSQKKGYDPLPYYTVIFVQPMGNGVGPPAGHGQPVTADDPAVGPGGDHGREGASPTGKPWHGQRAPGPFSPPKSG